LFVISLKSSCRYAELHQLYYNGSCLTL